MITKLLMAACLMLGPAATDHQLACHHHVHVQPGGPIIRAAPCASVVIAFRTASGHEADEPVTVCGGIGRVGRYQCDIARGGIVAGARLQCART